MTTCPTAGQDSLAVLKAGSVFRSVCTSAIRVETVPLGREDASDHSPAEAHRPHVSSLFPRAGLARSIRTAPTGSPACRRWGSNALRPARDRRPRASPSRWACRATRAAGPHDASWGPVTSGKTAAPRFKAPARPSSPTDKRAVAAIHATPTLSASAASAHRLTAMSAGDRNASGGARRGPRGVPDLDVSEAAFTPLYDARSTNANVVRHKSVRITLWGLFCVRWTVMAVGCGGAVEASPDITDSGTAIVRDAPDAADADAALAAQAACTDYLAAGTSACGPNYLPMSEMPQFNAGALLACQNEVALPGSGVTPTALHACASAIRGSPCFRPFPDLVHAIVYGTLDSLGACNFPGSLPTGAPCNENFQCATELCQGARDALLDGQPLPTTPPTCGTCAATADAGQSCTGSTCAPGTTCMNTGQCLAITYGSVGAACDFQEALCDVGLECYEFQCANLPANVGAPCVDTFGCAPPLICREAGLTCQAAGTVGTSCAVDEDCAFGLVCAGVCTAVTWVMPGQPCGGASMQCLVGPCGGSNNAPQPACPSIISDGQPCGSGTCDAYSECVSGVCTPIDGDICR
jgi:hypothetical protein